MISPSLNSIINYHKEFYLQLLEVIIITEERESNHSFGKVLSYSTVWFMDATILAFFGVTVFYFYEVEIGLTSTFVAIAYGIFAIWNMVNDPLTGYFTEKPRSWSKKYGLKTFNDFVIVKYHYKFKFKKKIEIL